MSEKITFFTPSFSGDAERFALLRESIKRFYKGTARHVVAVPKEDVALFKEITTDDEVDIFVQNDFVDSFFYPSKWFLLIKRFFPNQAWRFERFGGRNGWIIHIIVKFSIPEMIPDGAIILFDSDDVLIRPFSDDDFGISESQRALVRNEPKTESGKHPKFMTRSRLQLGLPEGSTDHHYMAHPDIWYSDWIVKLREHLEQIHKKKWQQALFDARFISSATLYGVFVEEALKPNNLFVRNIPFHHTLWDRESYDQFFAGDWSPATDKLTLVIQSNLEIPVSDYRSQLEHFWDQNNQVLDQTD